MRAILSRIILPVGVLVLALNAIPTMAQSSEWVVPPKFKKMENPTEASAENLALGKSLYAKHCKSCHGKAGLGDGSKAAELKGDLGDFSSAKFQAQSDGDIFYKSFEGRDDMPNYRKKIPNEEDMWFIVHFMRTMKSDN